jgi:hypothetical protein
MHEEVSLCLAPGDIGLLYRLQRGAQSPQNTTIVHYIQPTYETPSLEEIKEA